MLGVVEAEKINENCAEEDAKITADDSHANATNTHDTKQALLSIGSHTDTALDQLGIPNQIIPELRRIMTSFCSTWWIQILSGPEFSMKAKDAAILSNALLEDLKVSSMV